MKMHRAGKRGEWEGVKPSVRNVWQRVAARTDGYVTPANAVSVVGIMLVVIGLETFADGNFWRGIILIAVGRFADLLDGAVAERTHTKGPKGEALDAGLDKIAAMAALILFAMHGQLPVIPAVLIAVESVGIAVIVAVGVRRGVTVHPGASGKLATFAAWGVLLAFPIAWFAARNAMHVTRAVALCLGNLSIVAFVVLAVLTVRSYIAVVASRRENA
ncbi:MAG TPA: CDP-alcohol phosphatidyltransferase family protein [Candidatus Saccharimonadales bacterium]